MYTSALGKCSTSSPAADCVAASPLASGHNVSKRDASFVQSNHGPAIASFLYLGAKDIALYDHLAFLVGVIFFLYRIKDVVSHVGLFTVGHSITLLRGVLGGLRANPYRIDAVIGLSVVDKAFDNMGGVKQLLGFEPNTRAAVLIFGLFHGFGLATKLQELDLATNGLVQSGQLQWRRGDRANASVDCSFAAAALLSD